MTNVLNLEKVQQTFFNILYKAKKWKLIDDYEYSEIKNIILGLKLIVVGKWNGGKSTFINSWLGLDILPRGIVPTTKCNIIIKNGEELRTYIFFNNKKIVERGTELLHQFAKNTDNYIQKPEKIVVTYPLFLLEEGVEIFDTPGIDDYYEQDENVYRQVINADIVVYILDARKMFALNERNFLDKVIRNNYRKQIIFVTNYMNMIEKTTEVYRRTKDIVNNYKKDLNIPSNVNFLFFINALPVLKSRINNSVFKPSELLQFEDSISKIIKNIRKNTSVGELIEKINDSIEYLESILLKRRDYLKNNPSQFNYDDRWHSTILLEEVEKLKRELNLELSFKEDNSTDNRDNDSDNGNVYAKLPRPPKPLSPGGLQQNIPSQDEKHSKTLSNIELRIFKMLGDM